MAHIPHISNDDVVEWQNGASSNTPLSAENLNKVNNLTKTNLNLVIDGINDLQDLIGQLATALENLNNGEGV